MRTVGHEAAKSFAERERSGFWMRYAGGPVVLDVGYRGHVGDAGPVLPHACGIELGDDGYDGLRLPYPDLSVDAVHSSHVLEHVPDPVATLREWHRVLAVGGYMILFVPHAHLYERRATVPPSRWSREHLRCYTPATLLADVEAALRPNTYRVVHLRDNDDRYDYRLPPDVHPAGCYEIELVLRKAREPEWRIDP